MEEEDWWEIVRFIQDELRSIGHDEIADLSNYELREESKRRLSSPRHLVNEMLDALLREMSARSPKTLQDSLTKLGKLIDEGERPKAVFVWADEERARAEEREPRERLEGRDGANQAVEDLESLMRQLAEIDYRDGR
ncbi:MAG: hypothetical protein ACK5XN_06645 [Bacteroidota bacterium]